MPKSDENLESINDDTFHELSDRDMNLVAGGAEQLSFEQCGSDKVDVSIDPD